MKITSSTQQIQHRSSHDGNPAICKRWMNWKDPPFVMGTYGKSTISIAMFNSYVSYVKLPKGNWYHITSTKFIKNPIKSSAQATHFPQSQRHVPRLSPAKRSCRVTIATPPSHEMCPENGGVPSYEWPWYLIPQTCFFEHLEEHHCPCQICSLEGTPHYQTHPHIGKSIGSTSNHQFSGTQPSTYLHPPPFSAPDPSNPSFSGCPRLGARLFPEPFFR
jgi:hypothetical protein